MTLDQVLKKAAKAAGVPDPVLKEATAQLLKSAAATPAVEKLLAALAAGLPKKWRALGAEELGCARAALFCLGALVREGEDTRDQLVRQASLDEKREADARARYGEGAWRCPRCGSERVDDEHTGRGGERFMQLLCDACGAVGDGLDSSESITAWRRTS